MEICFFFAHFETAWETTCHYAHLCTKACQLFWKSNVPILTIHFVYGLHTHFYYLHLPAYKTTICNWTFSNKYPLHMTEINTSDLDQAFISLKEGAYKQTRKISDEILIHKKLVRVKCVCCPWPLQAERSVHFYWRFTLWNFAWWINSKHKLKKADWPPSQKRVPDFVCWCRWGPIGVSRISRKRSGDPYRPQWKFQHMQQNMQFLVFILLLYCYGLQWEVWIRFDNLSR